MTGIEIRGISKSYGGVHALRQVSLRLEPGEIHALCGENGAGKSTLIRVLSGSCTPDEGAVLVDDSPLTSGNVRASEDAGIAVIHQDPVVFPDLDAPENVFAGREPTRLGHLWLDRPAMVGRTRALLQDLGESFDLSLPVGQLPLAQRQMVAIARALHRSGQACRLLILDEPTASLSRRETQVLFRVVRQLKARGVGILYVSHRMEEIFELADRVSVLRDGELVATHPIAKVDRAGLIRLMVGRDTPLGPGGAAECSHGWSESTSGTRGVEATILAAPAGAEESNLVPSARYSEQPRSRRHSGDVRLDVRSLGRTGVFDNITFNVRAGEIVGLSGLVGAGRSEVAHAIAGIDRWDRGSVTVCGQALPPASPRRTLALGLALVPEDRQHEGLILPMSVGINLTMAVLKSHSRLGLISGRPERQTGQRLIDDLSIRAPGLRAAVETLSGGNQQKVLLGKWLATDPRVLILDEPTRGVDVGAKAEVHRLVRALAAKGLAALVISSDLPEILSLCDRIYVMRQGRIAGELQGADATQEKLMELALPSTADDPAPQDSAPTGARP